MVFIFTGLRPIFSKETCKKELDDGIYFSFLLGTVALYSVTVPVKNAGAR